MMVVAPQFNTMATQMPTSLIGRLFYYADNHPDHDAVVTPRFTLSYAQLAQLVCAQITEFNNAGISDNSTIGIQCAEDIRHLLLCLAATHIGATSFTIPSHESGETQKTIISRCGATHVVDESMAVDPMAPDRYAGAIEAHVPVPEALLLFSTSGTTGEPKLVIHRDSDLVAQAHRHVDSKQERFVCLASMDHNFAKRHRLYCVAAGATNVFLGTERESLVTQCERLNVNVVHISAFQAQELLGVPDTNKLASIRLKLGGSHVPLALRQQLRDHITGNLQAGYGTTETGAIAFTDPNDFNAGESVGKPLPGIEICVVSPERKPLKTGEHGELAIRCEGMFRGYLGNPDLTVARLADGWFFTGDIGYLDSQQRIHLRGRIDDMFVFNSMNIYPQDIESVIRSFPGVADTAVLPKKSPVHGNIPVALVVFTKNVKQKLPTLKKFVKRQVGVRSPRQYIIVDKIPTNASGKISRREAMDLQIRSDQIRGDIFDLLGPRIKSRLKDSLITAFKNGDTDIAFQDIGMDSLSRMEFLIALETEYDTIITPREYATYRYLGNIVSHVLSQRQHELEDAIVYSSNGSGDTETSSNIPPYVVRFFQRIISFCHTSVQLNKALNTLENRLTPTEVEHLYEWHTSGQLVPTGVAKKLKITAFYWLEEIKNLMLRSGKEQPEPFVWRRVAPSVAHFSGPGSPAEKTLLICFPPSGVRNMMMPNAVFMQHTNSAYYDLLVISGTFNESYRYGIPHNRDSLTGIIEWLTAQDLIGKYGYIRTLGFSAGSYPALLAASTLKAEIAVSVSGRFQKKRYLLRNLVKLIAIWRAGRRSPGTRVLISYAADNSRDRKYARIIAAVSGINSVAVEFADDKIGHLILQRLLDRGELKLYLSRTIFADRNDDLIVAKRKNVVMNFPGGQIRSQ